VLPSRWSGLAKLEVEMEVKGYRDRFAREGIGGWLSRAVSWAGEPGRGEGSKGRISEDAAVRVGRALVATSQKLPAAMQSEQDRLGRNNPQGANRQAEAAMRVL
jgi:hypothetical protein